MTFQSQCPTLVKLSETKPPNKNLKHWLQARDTTEKEGPASALFSVDKKQKISHSIFVLFYFCINYYLFII